MLEAGDYNGDGSADVLLRNDTSGRWYVYLTSGASILSEGPVSATRVGSWVYL